jgi:hypothetical protein
MPRDAIFEQTRELLVTTFNRDGLRLLLKMKLKVRLYDIASPDKHDSAIILTVLDWARSKGRLIDLIRAAAAERLQVPEWQALRAQVPVPPDEVVIEAHRLLVETFARDDLEVLLRTKLGIRMNTLTTPTVDNTVAALDVVEWFEKRYRLCELIRAAAAERGHVPDWQFLRDNHCPAMAP